MATTATPKTTVKRTPKPKATTTPKVTPKAEEPVKVFRNSKRGYNREARVMAWHKRLHPVPGPASVVQAFSGSDPRSTFVLLRWDGSERSERVHYSTVRPLEDTPKAA